MPLRGGDSTDAPFRHYIEVMTTRDAYSIIKKYHIYLPPELSDVAREVEHTILYPTAPRLTPTAEEYKIKISVTPEQLTTMIREEVQRALGKA